MRIDVIARSARTTMLLTAPGVVSAIVVMPVLALGPLAFLIREDFDLSTADVGITFSGFFLCSAALAGVGGALTSRISPSWTAMGGLALTCAVAVLAGSAPTRETLIGACLFAGVLNGLVTPALNILITESVPQRLRGLAFGIKVSAVPAASSAAALSALVIVGLDLVWRQLFLGIALAAALLLVVTAPVLRSSGSHRRNISGVVKGRAPLQRSLVLLGVAGLLGGTGTGVLAPFVVDGLVARDLSPSAASVVLAVGGWLGIVSRIIVGIVSDRLWGALTHLQLAAGLLFVGAIGTAGLAVGHGSVVLVTSAILAFSLGWAWPGLLHHAALSTHAERPGQATGYMQTGTYLGAVIGPVSFGFLAEEVSFGWAWALSSVVVFAAALALLASVGELHRAERRLRIGGGVDSPAVSRSSQASSHSRSPRE